MDEATTNFAKPTSRYLDAFLYQNPVKAIHPLWATQPSQLSSPPTPHSEHRHIYVFRPIPIPTKLNSRSPARPTEKNAYHYCRRSLPPLSLGPVLRFRTWISTNPSSALCCLRISRRNRRPHKNSGGHHNLIFRLCWVGNPPRHPSLALQSTERGLIRLT
jgi:hypothetical protein